MTIPAASGLAAAHFHGPDVPSLEIDVKPGSDKNPINPHGWGVVPVAVLRTDDFDPTSENVNYRFGARDVVEDGGGARPVYDGHVVDVDRDGRDDLLLYFPVHETGFEAGDTEGHIHWERGEKGASHGLAGSDDVTIVGRPFRPF